MTNIFGLNQRCPEITRDLQNHGFTAEGTVYTNPLQKEAMEEHLFPPPCTPGWQWAVMIGTTEKVLLSDPVEALWKAK